MHTGLGALRRSTRSCAHYLLGGHKAFDDQVLQLHLAGELTHRVQQVVLLLLLLDL
jgi:hypothetical protein